MHLNGLNPKFVSFCLIFAMIVLLSNRSRNGGFHSTYAQIITMPLDSMRNTNRRNTSGNELIADNSSNNSSNNSSSTAG
jgi:hypothetical protein